MEMKSHLARVRGLGAANEGAGHWLSQRLSGVALIPLVLWFVFSIVDLTGADLAAFKTWAGAHYNPLLLILLSLAMFYHAQLGLRVVIEDYIHNEAVKTVSLALVRLGAIFLGASCVFAVLRLTFGG